MAALFDIARMKADSETKLGITHREEGVWWYKAPVPGRLHRCKGWTVSMSQGIERCACGGLHFLDDPFPIWLGRLHWWNRRPKR